MSQQGGGRNAAQDEGTYHQIFGGMDDSSLPFAAAAAAAAEAPSVYVGRDAIRLEVQNQRPADVLYAMPSSAQTSENVVEVENLSELSRGANLQMGTRLGVTESTTITGAVDFCIFLNGVYLKLKGVEFNGKPVFRTKVPASSATPSFCNGNHLFLFYHERNKAWVVGMKVNAGSGACAYFVADAPSPELVRVTARDCWHVSMENGGFCECRTMVCAKASDSEMEPPADFALPGSNSVPGRNEAESMLRDHQARQGDDAVGYFVLRESTSVPNAHVISILLRHADVEHLIVTKGQDGRLMLDPQYTAGAAAQPSFPSLREVKQYGADSGFMIREQNVKLTRVIHGQELLH